LDAAGALVDDIEIRQPSMDDVFFALTGGHIEEDEKPADVPVALATAPGPDELEGATA
jgi:hypothetical protein